MAMMILKSINESVDQSDLIYTHRVYEFLIFELWDEEINVRKIIAVEGTSYKFLQAFFFAASEVASSTPMIFVRFISDLVR